MTSQDAATLASSWLEWGSAYSLPQPHYVTIGVYDSGTLLGFQLNTPGDVSDWARCLRVDANGTTADGELFTRARYRTGDYELECYSVTKLTATQPTLDEAAAS